LFGEILADAVRHQDQRVARRDLDDRGVQRWELAADETGSQHQALAFDAGDPRSTTPSTLPTPSHVMFPCRASKTARLRGRLRASAAGTRGRRLPTIKNECDADHGIPPRASSGSQRVDHVCLRIDGTALTCPLDVSVWPLAKPTQPVWHEESLLQRTISCPFFGDGGERDFFSRRRSRQDLRRTRCRKKLHVQIVRTRTRA
jgi:hypothetical protein